MSLVGHWRLDACWQGIKIDKCNMFFMPWALGLLKMVFCNKHCKSPTEIMSVATEFVEFFDRKSCRPKVEILGMADFKSNPPKNLSKTHKMCVSR